MAVTVEKAKEWMFAVLCGMRRREFGACMSDVQVRFYASDKSVRKNAPVNLGWTPVFACQGGSCGSTVRLL